MFIGVGSENTLAEFVLKRAKIVLLLDIVVMVNIGELHWQIVRLIQIVSTQKDFNSP